MKIERRPKPAMLPLPAVLITVRAGERTNILTISWAGVVNSTPPMVSVSIRPSRYSHELLRSSGEFVVNLPRADQVRQVDMVGTVSGRDVEKFAYAGFTPEAASAVRAPLIAECPVNLECVVRHELSLGSHDMFVGEVVATHYAEDVLDIDGRLNTAAFEGLAYVVGEYWVPKVKLGAGGYTRRAPAGGARD